MELRIYIRRLQLHDIAGNPVYYAGANPQSLQMQQGTIDQQWLDMTPHTAGLDKLKLTWTVQRDSSGTQTLGGFDVQKAASGSLFFEGDAYKLIKQWCVDDVAAPLNSIEVKIEDIGCGTYEGWVIKSSQLTWCQNEQCSFDATLKQQDEAYTCIHRTLISDNWQGWFQTQPAGGRKHPRFSYCNEQRPNGIMIIIWWMAAVVIAPTLMVMIPILAILNVIIWVINKIIGVIASIINAIASLFGGDGVGDVDWDVIPSFDLQGILDSMGQFFVESAGCGREHPAPLVRDYISNVCTKCNIVVDELTCPIFFSPTLRSPEGNFLNASSGKKEGMNPHYDACYLTATLERGIRRFRSLNVLGSNANNTDFYLPSNAPILALDQFLDELKAVYNAEWRIKQVNGKPHLYFWRKDWFLQPLNQPIYDLSDNAPDRHKILEGVCFEWNEVKYPAYAKGLYQLDAADTCGNEALNQMNGYVSFGDVDKNPLYSDELDKTAAYGGTKFRLDGASTDYIYDAMQVVTNSALLTPFMAGLMRDFVAPQIRKYSDYGLLLRDETCTLPKILLWDGQSHLNAKAIKPKSAYFIANAQIPAANLQYNKPVPILWFMKHFPKTFVIGSGMSLGNNPVGYYKVQDIFGIVASEQPAMLVNYPMYFEPGYEDTMWDWFHWVDDVHLRPRMNMNWNVKLEHCCDDVKDYDSNGQKKLGLLNNAGNIALGEKVKLPLPYYSDGIITEIEISYDPGDINGRYIQLKGTV